MAWQFPSIFAALRKNHLPRLTPHQTTHRRQFSHLGTAVLTKSLSPQSFSRYSASHNTTLLTRQRSHHTCRRHPLRSRLHGRWQLSIRYSQTKPCLSGSERWMIWARLSTLLFWSEGSRRGRTSSTWWRLIAIVGSFCCIHTGCIVLTSSSGRRTEEIWDTATFIERSKAYIGTIPQFVKGRFRNITALPQRHAKNALHWLALRHVPNFASISSQWSSELTAYIHFIAKQFDDLQPSRYDRHKLTDSELSLFYEAIIENADEDIDNTKQHFVAWLLAYFTAVRPGSMTVCNDYGKGARFGSIDNGKERPADETLRWSDLKWVRYPRGIGVNITFRFLKSQRDPYSEHQAIGQCSSI